MTATAMIIGMLPMSLGLGEGAEQNTPPEESLVNARTAEMRTVANYNQAIANLQRGAAATLRANNVIVKPPSTP